MSFCLWITGLPGSGKSTIAKALVEKLEASGVEVIYLSLDHLRRILTPEPRYTEEERSIVYRSLAVMARLLVQEARKNVIIDATGNRREYRDLARQLMPEFAEVYVQCPLEVCMEREAARRGQPVQRDLYKTALQGKLEGGLPGVSVPYEEPQHPEVRVHSNGMSPNEAANEIKAYLQARWLTPSGERG